MSTPTQLSERRPLFPTNVQAFDTRTRGVEELIPVLLVDSRPLTREWLAKWLEEVLGVFHVTAVAGPDDVGHEDRRRDAELTILNVGTAAAADPGIADEIGRLRRRLPDIPIVLFAESDEIAQVAAAIRQGVRGYITSTLSPEVAIAVLRLVQSGGTFVPASVVLQGVQHRQRPEQEPAPRVADTRLDNFTPRELEVLDRLSRGMSNKMIAYELNICENTVKVHVMHIMRKLQTTNRTQAALRARCILGDENS
jgi:DNA-binding NarL/FixJ family response regulator